MAAEAAHPRRQIGSICLLTSRMIWISYSELKSKCWQRAVGQNREIRWEAGRPSKEINGMPTSSTGWKFLLT
ncbi:hypothetical protein AVEN_165880-1 [Araneus ventricosus]|uniref:Uncharacterized protein n=1 Tax=Araneus ventricosus TaxID=182803 RepID=A0A4Y2T053_ARAVE|nr:hypothetical protein AVEN_165880-1 [Araneus ventricosus]